MNEKPYCQICIKQKEEKVKMSALRLKKYMHLTIVMYANFLTQAVVQEEDYDE